MSASEIVNKVWNYAHVLRDDLSACNLAARCTQAGAQADGVAYGDYVEVAPAYQCARDIRISMFNNTTILIYLKIADEREQADQHYILCVIVRMLCELLCLQYSGRYSHKSCFPERVI